MIGKNLGTVPSAEDYEMLRDIISTKSRENLKNTLTTLLDKLIQQKYRNNSSLFNYLKRDIDDFAVELCVTDRFKL